MFPANNPSTSRGGRGRSTATVKHMNVINTVLTVFGVVVGAAFLLGGGLLLPLWEQLETRGERNGADK